MPIAASDLILFRQLFFHRQDVFAEQYKIKSGTRAGEIGYSPACSNRWDKTLCNGGKCRQCSHFASPALGDDVIEAHFKGERTIGSYLVSSQGTVNLMVLDVDIDKAGSAHPEIYRERVQSMTRQLYRLASHYGLDVTVEFSGSKGYHLWLFFAAPVPAGRAQSLGNWLVAQADVFEGVHVEVFPKQESIDQYGNLVKVPVGVHLKSGKRCFLVDPETLQGEKKKQLERLRAIRTVPNDTINFVFDEYDIAPKVANRVSGNGAVPKGASLPCVPKMWAGVTEGCRDEVAFRLAVHLNKQGMPQVFAENILSRWDNDYNDPPLGELITAKVASAYSGKYGFGCTSPLIQPFCEAGCPVYKKRQEPEPVVEEEVRASAELRFLKLDPADSTMIFCRQGLEYRCSGIEAGKEGVKATIELRSGEGASYKDRLGLAIANRRKGFTKGAIAQIPELDYQAVLNDLTQLDGAIRLKQAEIFAEEAAAKTTEYVMSIEEEQAALALLRSPKLLHHAFKIIERLGVVGENENKLVVFLGYTSRILAEPIQIYIKGESSSGKSFVSRKVLELFPKECYVELTDMTPQALFYMQDTDMSHKIIILFERHGSEKADYAIRSSISEGKLSIAVPIKDPDTNQMVTKTLEVEGPLMFLTTTTDAFLNPENETRNISLYSDDSEQQTEIIRKADIDRFLLKRKGAAPAEILLWQNAQRLLKTYPVRVSFVKEISDSFPKKPVRVRRDFTRFIRLIHTVTVLHQFQRPILKDEDGEEFLDATIGDYYIAKKLAEKVFAQAVIEIGPKAIEVWKYCYERKFEKDGTTRQVFTYASVAKGIEWKTPVTRKWVLQLGQGGYLAWINEDEEGEDGGKKHKGSKGKVVRFTLSDKDYADMSVLPEADDLIVSFPALAGDIYDPITGEEPDDIPSF